MRQTFFNAALVFVVLVTIFAASGCSSADAPQVEPEETFEALSAPADVEPTHTAAVPTATPPPSPTAATLKTEIIEEPISPVSPLKTPESEQAAMPMPDIDNLPPASETPVKAAVADLAQTHNINPANITVVSVEAVEWNDASLGCPQEGFMYAQVITSGYLIILEAQGRQFEYHTNQQETVVLCEQ